MLASRGFVYRSSESAGNLDHYHANCVTGDTRVGGRGLVAVLRRKHEGALVRVATSRGDEFTITPEHPVLTERGWVLADHLVEGDGLVRASLSHGHEVCVPDEDDVYPTAEEVFEAARFLASAVGHGVPAAAEDFDGEVIANGDVEVVFIDRSLRDALEIASLEPCEHQVLSNTGAMSVGSSLVSSCPLDKLLVGQHTATRRSVGGSCLSCSFLGGHLGRPDETGVRTSSQLAAGLDEPSCDGGSADAEFIRELEHARSVLVAFDGAFGHRDSLASGLDAVTPKHPIELGLADSHDIADLVRLHPGEVEVDDVTVVERLSGSCHFYNFRTLGHWFTCDNIVTHNCDCRVVPQFGGESYEGYDPDEYYDRYQKLMASGELDAEGLAASARRVKAKKRVTPRARGPRETGDYQRISGQHTRQDDIANANPNFEKGLEYQVNCQRCVPTYLARRRGYDVVARPAVLDEHGLDKEDEFKNHWTEIYGGAHFSDFTDCGAPTRNAQLRNVERFMRSCGDNATAVVYIQWESGSAHVFVADRVDGKTTYCDPQSGRQSCKSYFQFAKTEESAVAVLRIDDRDMPEGLLKECCENRV